MKQYSAFFMILLCSILIFCLSGCSGESEAPVLRNLTWAVGAPLPHAEDFAASIPDGGSLAYAQDYKFRSMGTYDLILLYTDTKGNTREYPVQMTLTEDKIAPVITGASDLTVYLGEGVSYRSGVTVTDNCDGKVTLDVDSSAVNLKQVGSYPVFYTARDGAGNTSTVKITVYVHDVRISLDDLHHLLDPIIASEIPSSGTKEEKVRAVYRYVYGHISYGSTSEKGDPILAAYEGLRTGNGDCYTYFALSKAFFDRLGIRNLDVERLPSAVERARERHYWNLVDIGEESSPRWYHFDATHLSGEQHSGCLLTDRQIAAYNQKRVSANGATNYFYAYDSTAYPASSTQEITPTPGLT